MLASIGLACLIAWVGISRTLIYLLIYRTVGSSSQFRSDFSLVDFAPALWWILPTTATGKYRFVYARSNSFASRVPCSPDTSSASSFVAPIGPPSSRIEERPEPHGLQLLCDPRMPRRLRRQSKSSLHRRVPLLPLSRRVTSCSKLAAPSLPSRRAAGQIRLFLIW